MTQNPPLSLPDSESVGIGNEPKSSLLSFLTGDAGDDPWDDSREESERLKIAKKESIALVWFRVDEMSKRVCEL